MQEPTPSPRPAAPQRPVSPSPLACVKHHAQGKAYPQGAANAATAAAPEPPPLRAADAPEGTSLGHDADSSAAPGDGGGEGAAAAAAAAAAAPARAASVTPPPGQATRAQPPQAAPEASVSLNGAVAAALARGRSGSSGGKLLGGLGPHTRMGSQSGTAPVRPSHRALGHAVHIGPPGGAVAAAAANGGAHGDANGGTAFSSGAAVPSNGLHGERQMSGHVAQVGQALKAGSGGLQSVVSPLDRSRADHAHAQHGSVDGRQLGAAPVDES